MTTGIYRCSTDSYDICDMNGNPQYVWELHDIPEGNEEIGTESTVNYCLNCHILLM